jgi:hypothetical protein
MNTQFDIQDIIYSFKSFFGNIDEIKEMFNKYIFEIKFSFTNYFEILDEKTNDGGHLANKFGSVNFKSEPYYVTVN